MYGPKRLKKRAGELAGVYPKTSIIAKLTVLPTLVAGEWRVLWQRFDDVIKPQPQAPTVVIKRDGKYQGHNKKHHEHALVIHAENQQTEETYQQNREFRRYDIRENRADEESFLAFEQRHAHRAMVSDFEGLREDFLLPARRTEQS